MEWRGRRQAVARGDHSLEAFAARRPARQPVHDLGRVARGCVARPGVGLTMHAQDVGPALAQQRRDRAARWPVVAARVQAMAAARAGLDVADLHLDHRVERPQQRLEALAVALQMTEHMGQRLDRGHAVEGGLAPNGVVCALLGRGEAQLRQTQQRRVGFQQPLRLAPGPVDQDESHRLPRRHGLHVARRRPWIDDVGLAAGQRCLHHGIVGEIDAHAQQGARQTQPRNASGADAHVALARVLQDDHTRAGLQGRDVRAVADGGGPATTLAQGARRGFSRDGQGGSCHP